MWCGQSSPKHNLCWGKFIHLENLLFTLCDFGECFLLKNKWCTSNSSAFDWCVKPKSINFSNTELQNKQDRPAVCWSLLSVQPTLWFCCQANSKAPKIEQVFPYATCNILTITLVCCFLYGVIHYEADVTVRKSSIVEVNAQYWVQFTRCLGGRSSPNRASGRMFPNPPYYISKSNWFIEVISKPLHGCSQTPL